MPAVDLGLPLARPHEGLYWDPDADGGDGAKISTHSMLKTFRRCPKQAEFKYVHRLKPKKLGSPLKRGTWMHSLLETFHNGDDWRLVHTKLSKQFDVLFDEEKDYYGDMPTEILAVMEAYIWHYKDDPWEIVKTEFQVEAMFPDGTVYRGKVDMLIRDSHGLLWLVDHKTHKTLPDLSFRLLDAQSALYLWAAQENGLIVQGFIWNYIKWKAPSVPSLLKDGSRISKVDSDTDYPTFYRALKKYKEENPNFVITPENKAKLHRLKAARYEYGKPQTSDFFRRDILEKSPEMIERVVQGNYTTSLRMHDYDFTNPDYVERVVERGCTFSCSFTDICTAELMGANITPLLKQNYTVGDPNSYYNDKAGDYEKEER